MACFAYIFHKALQTSFLFTRTENPVELAVFATKFLELIPMFFRTLHKLKKKTVPFIQQTTV